MTLIEVMVVMVILAMLAVAATINVLRSLNTARINDTKSRARTIQSAALAYIMEGGDGCPALSDLEDFLDPTTESSDGWGNDFEITCEDNVVHVRSAGADGSFQTEDDIAL